MKYSVHHNSEKGLWLFGLIDECDRVSNSQVIGRAFQLYLLRNNQPE